jgi:hypothetical protein
MAINEIIQQVSEKDGPVKVDFSSFVFINIKRIAPIDLMVIMADKQLIYLPHDGPRGVAMFERII